ncbi:NAD-dependent epimerase/dehydratase family protein [Albibacterium profundi]|uniref:NAD-dependent epimerase/dehydratase family protein n=1 Tax=Albibacterium profundi TaxID=3134906 RepID=A0ABV5CE02_9SPHI
MILVTGGTGFIGSLLIEKLLQTGNSVLAIKRKESTIPQTLLYKKNLFWFDADITDYFALEDVFTNVSQVYHCAGLVSFDTADRNLLQKINVEGTTHIVNLCLAKKTRLLHVSSVAALGDEKEDTLITEKSKWEWDKKKSAYSVSKFEAEREVWRGIAEGLDAVIVNPTIVLGAGDKKNGGQIFTRLQKGLKFYPTGSTGFVDVVDLVNIMIRLMSETQITGTNFLINNANMTYQELFEQYAHYHKITPPDVPASRLLMGVVWRIQNILRLLRLSKSKLSRDIVRSARKKNQYSNEKIIQTLDYTFKPMKQTLKELVE